MKKHELATRLARVEKQLVISPKNELEVGKWYKYIPNAEDTERQSIIALFSGVELSSNYGFDFFGEWSTNITLYNHKLGTEIFLATSEEVKSALVVEAKRRGYIDGVEFVCVGSDRKGIYKESDIVYKNEPNDGIYVNNSKYGEWLFINGIWATIVTEPEKPETKVVTVSFTETLKAMLEDRKLEYQKEVDDARAVSNYQRAAQFCYKQEEIARTILTIMELEQCTEAK